MKTLSLARVLITGAAQGIGRELALAFADEGAELVLTDVKQEQLERTRDEIFRLLGGSEPGTVSVNS